jgi:hypothetical protein
MVASASRLSPVRDRMDDIMRITRLQALTLATAGCAVLFHSHAMAQNQDQDKPVFAAPKRIHAGKAFLGEGRYYPSPVLQDVNGDQLPDIVVGDLFGKVTYAPRLTGKKVRFGAEKELKDRSGALLKFHNW